MPNLIVDAINRLRYKLPSRPRQVQLEVTNQCNLDCPMCPREVMDIELDHMAWDTFCKVVDRLQGDEDITLTGWGEPFLHPRIFDMISHCQRRGHKVRITSNGLFPRPDMAGKIIDSGLDALTFSVDSLEGEVPAGHASARARRNLEQMPALRRNGRPYLRLQATLHAAGEKALYDVIRFGALHGYNAVNVGRVDRKYDPTLQRPEAVEEARIFHEADRLARQLGIQLDWLQYSVSRGLVRFLYRLLRKKLHRSGRYCLKTYDYSYITREGFVTPCCLLPEKKIGSALDEDLGAVWNNAAYRHFRENYRDTCGSCDLWTVDMVDHPAPEKTKPAPVPT
ncbi:MAG: radical SAM/SPASM domain-containing protein [Nitrospinaceae bacterium]